MNTVLRDGIVFPESDDHFHGKVSEYQKPVFDLAMQHVKRTDGLAVDAGAHVGIFSRRMSPFAEVLSFEPDPFNYACLVENVASFSWIKPVCAALGRTNGWGKVRIDAAHNSGARSFVPDYQGDIRIFPLDLFMSMTVMLIKIDTQGAEGEILYGANMILRRDKPVLIVEMPDTDTTIYLMNLGYKIAGRVNKDCVFVGG